MLPKIINKKYKIFMNLQIFMAFSEYLKFKKRPLQDFIRRTLQAVAKASFTSEKHGLAHRIRLPNN